MAEMQELHDTAVESEGDTETTPDAPQSSIGITGSVLRNPQPADGRGIAKEGAKKEQEGISTSDEAHTRQQPAPVTLSGAQAEQHAPLPVASARVSEVGHIYITVQQAPGRPCAAQTWKSFRRNSLDKGTLSNTLIKLRK